MITDLIQSIIDTGFKEIKKPENQTYVKNYIIDPICNPIFYKFLLGFSVLVFLLIVILIMQIIIMKNLNKI
jgi:hypothetical protein